MVVGAEIDTMSIELLGLPTKTLNSLLACGRIQTIGELRSKSLKELRALPLIGTKGIQAIKQALCALLPPS